MSVKKRTKLREMAARMVAEDEQPDAAIAVRVGISERTLERWKTEPEFRERVTYFVRAYTERALRYGLARKEKRLSVLNDMHERLLRIIDERARSGELGGVPGASTGLICKTLKGIGKGEDYQVVPVYEVDTAIVREIRAVQEQVADELGQRVQKHRIGISEGADEDPQTLTDEQLLERVEQLNRKLGYVKKGDANG